MGLCFSHSDIEGNYDEGTKLCGSIASPVSFSNLKPSSKGQQICSRTTSTLPLILGKTRRRRTLAALFPSMNYFKTKVSKNRNRHKEHGFDLDLTYITDRIIAMAYPAERVQSIFRNHLNDVYDFLELKHKGHYYIYNLCSERSYDKAKFCNRVKVYPFDDHNPPSFVIIQSFCEDVHRWLETDPKNVIAIHCKAGKGRTGTMICCYLLHSRMYGNAEDALQFYGKKRTQDGQGVTIPSQIRYVKYYAQYLKEKLTYKPRRIYIKRILMKPAPKFSEPVLFTIKQKKQMDKNTKTIKTYIRDTRGGDAKKNDGQRDGGECSKVEGSYEGKYHEMGVGFKSRNFSFRTSDPEVVLDDKIVTTHYGDVRIELFYRSPVFTKKKRFARIWINTFFADLNGIPVEDHKKCLVFKKQELDIVGKKDKNNKLLTEDFVLTVHIKSPSTEEEIQAALEESKKKEEAVRKAIEIDEDEESSGAEDDSDDENDWDSGKSHFVISPAEGGGRVLNKSREPKMAKSCASFFKENANLEKFPAFDFFKRRNEVEFENSRTNIAKVTIKPVGHADGDVEHLHSGVLGTDPRRTNATSPSITSSSSDTTTNASVKTAIFLSKETKMSLSTDSSSSVDTSTAHSTEVARNHSNCNNASRKDANKEEFSKSELAIFTVKHERNHDLTSNIISNVVPNSSSSIDLSNSDASAITGLATSKSEKSFFKTLSKKFYSKK